jgi:hypothetical protein
MKKISAAIMFAMFSALTVPTLISQAGAQQKKNQQTKSTTLPTTNRVAPKSGCGLLPISLLEKTFGEKFDDEPMEGKMPPAYDGAWGTTCKFSPKPPFTKEHPTTAEFIVFVEASPAVAKQTFDQAAAYFADGTKPKPGIGDSSYWALADEKEPRIAVLKGKTHFSLQLEPPNESKLKELATAVAAQL